MKSRCLLDKRKSICLFLLLFIAYALIYMTKNCFSAAMASIVDNGIMTKSETGLISAMFYLIYAPFQIVGGIAVDRFSPYKMVLIGFIGAGVSNLLIYFVESYVGMIIIWSFNAIIQFGVWPGIFKIISTELKPEHRMNGIFYISMAATVGLVFSYISAAIITDWKNNFLLSAVVLIILSVAFYFAYRALEKSMCQDPTAEGEPDVKNRGEPPTRVNPLPLMLKAGIPLLLMVDMIHSMLNLGIKALAPTMLVECYDSVSPSIANLLNIILIIAGPVGLVASHNPIFQKMNAPTAMSLLLAGIVPSLVLVSFIGRIDVVFIIIALTVLMILAGAMSIFFSYISRHFAKFGCVGTLTGLFNCMASLGIVLANYMFAKFAEDFGWSFATIGWLVLTAIAFLLCLVAIPLFNSFKKKYSIK